MIDTFAVSKTFARPPDQKILESKGWQPLRDRYTDRVRALCFNSARGEHEPRLTLSQNPNDFWIIRAEVSIPAWLKGSNLCLPDESDIHTGLDSLSEYVENNSGIIFDAHTERVTRVDYTKDFQVGENAVLPIIARFSKLKLPRYKRACFDETSVYFKNAGKERTKEYLIYSKYHERLAKTKNESEQEMAKGLIRLENSFRKRGVNALAKSLKLQMHTANYLLTKETAEMNIQRAMNKLNFEHLLTPVKANIENLFDVCDNASALTRIGFLYLRDKYGEDFSKLPFIDLSPKTLKRYFDDCQKAGVLSLE
jgi:hypothetical protein